MSHRISQAIRCSLESHEIFETAVNELGAYLNVDRCSLFMRDDRGVRAMNVADIIPTEWNRQLPILL
jgi:GAF domain-containing protein